MTDSTQSLFIHDSRSTIRNDETELLKNRE